jgi:hypothetical protein
VILEKTKEKEYMRSELEQTEKINVIYSEALKWIESKYFSFNFLNYDMER